MRYPSSRAVVALMRRFLRSVCGGRSVVFATGLLAGVYALTGVHLFLATFGTALPAMTALIVGLAAGIEVAWKPPRNVSDRAKSLRWLAALHVFASVWMLLLPWGFGLAMAVAGNIPLEVMAAPGRLLVFECLVAMVLVTPVVVVWTRFPLGALRSVAVTSRDDDQTRSIAGANQTEPADEKPQIHPRDVDRIALEAFYRLFRFIPRTWRRVKAWWRYKTNRPLAEALLPLYFAGFAVGLLCDVFLLAPLTGVYVTGLVAAGIGVMAGMTCVWRSLQIVEDNATQQVGAQSHAVPAASPTVRRRQQYDAILRLTGVGLLGAIAAVLLRMLHQLAPGDGYLFYVAGVALLLGAAAGIRSALRSEQSLSPRGIWGALVAGAVALIAYPWLIDLSLWMNVLLTEAWAMMAARSALIALFLLPIGSAWGGLVVLNRQPTDAITAPLQRISGMMAFPFAAGFLVIRWFAFLEWTPADILVCLLWALAALTLVHWLVLQRRVTATDNSIADTPVTHWRLWTGRAMFAAVAVLLLVTPWMRSHYDPVRAARLLFATNVSIARLSGLDDELLPFLDEGRPLDRRDGQDSTLSLWRYRGTQLQIRENGIPKALVSTRPGLCPQFSAQVMPTVLPLVLHESPQRVMLLGVGGGVSLTTTLSFPVQSVTCVEGNPQLLQLLQEQVWTESREKMAEEHRLRLLAIEPAMAVACKGEEYDVIVSTTDQSALLKSAPYYTRGFYRRVAHRLAPQGIFCQRFSQVDYGPMPLQTAVKTLQAEFRYVAAIEIASGEMALLATNADEGLVRDGLVERFQLPHVRTVLSRVGWDWSLPLNLTAYSHDGLKEFAASTGMNTAANGRLAFRLPQEVMRWGPKWQELRKLIAPHGTRFLAAEGVDGNDPALLRRLSELAGQRKLMTAFPDQWWAYRKAVRKQLKERPRTLVKSVRDGGGKRIHAEDKRRMNYFRDLAHAVEDLTPESIRDVAAYTEPYDPLLSYFAHHEVASLYARGKTPDKRAELWHRLHAVYYAHPHDRSVRDVTAALTLLGEHADAVDSAADRWDHLNALLQILKTRWTTRGLIAPKSPRLVFIDIERSLQAIDKAFVTMAKLHSEVGIKQADWEARKLVLERGLVRPLQTYRDALMKQHRFETTKLKLLMQQIEKDSREGQNDKEGSKPKKGPKKPSPPSAN